MACPGEVARLRAVKDEGELTRILEASKLADEALHQTLEAGVVGRTEREVAVELEFRMRRLGAEGPSFESIVAAGAQGALPHAQPRDETIPADTLLIIDWGALLDGYCSDCTRTYATGEGISDRQREAYASVLEAQLAGLAAVRPGSAAATPTRPPARCSSGRVSASASDTGSAMGWAWRSTRARACRAPKPTPSLQAGNVVTVEPGVYMPGASSGCGSRTSSRVGEQEQPDLHRPSPRSSRSSNERLRRSCTGFRCPTRGWRRRRCSSSRGSRSRPSSARRGPRSSTCAWPASGPARSRP